jgi:hypothetical protein
MSTYETYEYQRGPFQPGEYETFETGYEMYEGEDEQFLGDLLKTVGKVVGPQLPGIAKGIFGALTSGGGGPLSATQEMELTAELLEITSEEELEEFLGNIMSGVARTVGGVINSPEAKALGGVLKGVAKDALPFITSAAGTALGGMAAPYLGPAAPALGGIIGGTAGQQLATRVFEMELEGMTQEQAQFEMGRRIVGLAATSAAHAAKAPRGAPPAKVARAAITKAARQHAPGLLRGAGAGAGGGGRGRPQQAGAGGGPRGQRRPGPGARPPVPGGRPLGAAAFPGADTASGAPAYAGGNGEPEPDDPSATEPTYGAPDWSEPEPDGDGPEGAGPRGRSGRWIRRGGQIVLLGA